jgi:hypothetical protein
MSIELHTTYFRNQLLGIPAKVADGTLPYYGGYHTTSCSDTVELNGHFIQMEYSLRMDVANGEEKTLHPIPLVQIELTMTLRPDKDSRATSSIMSKVIKVQLNSETLEEQIDEAIQTLERIIIDVKLPTITFDFWKYVAMAMPDFEKQVSKTVVTNHNRLSYKD